MNLTDRLTALRDGLAISSEWLWTLVANHLWQSTLCAALAFLAVVLLRRSPARARYAIWLIAATKFILPSVLLVGLADATGVDLSALMPSAPHPQAVIAQVAEPVAYAPVELAPVEPAGTAATPPRVRDWYSLLTMVWLAGFVALLAAWRRKRTQFSAAMRAGELVSQGKEAESLKRVRSWLLLKREVRLIISPKIAEPGVWGTFRPIIVLPESIAERLSEAELDAVMMHEMIHIARQDNLVSNLQMFLCCLFWFHPLVWMIDRRLLVERESACDEQVIELGGAHGVYAASLLKVLKFCLGFRVAGVSAASGSNLKRRIEKIMSNEVNSSLALRQRLIVVALAMTVVIVSAAAGLLRRNSVVAQNRQTVAGGVQGGIPGGVPGGVPGGIAGGIAGGVPGGVEGGAPGLPQEYKITDTDKELDQAPESIIRFRNKNNTPVSITEAKMKMVKTPGMRQRQNGVWTQTGDTYAYRATLQLVNNTGNRVKGIAIEFEDAEDNTSMAYVGQRLMIEPHSTYTFNLKYGKAFFEDVTTMTARVVGVLFENGDGWGKLPPPPPPPPPPVPPSPATPPSEVEVPAPPDAPPTTPVPMVEGVVVRKVSGILQTSALRRVEPEYPPLAKAAQVSGLVVLEVVIDEGGRVIGARVINGHPLLRDAAVGAARQWEFQPTSVDGKPVKVVGTLTFNFSL